MGFFSRSVAVLIACVGMFGITGCGGGDSNVGAVNGTVTIDGQTVEGALVTFYPTDGRASGGYTDANGVYTLKYVAGQDGAVIGKHRVTIKSEIQALTAYDEAVEGQEGQKPRKEMLPKKYRDTKKTELTATVKQGSNVINFDLEVKKK